MMPTVTVCPYDLTNTRHGTGRGMVTVAASPARYGGRSAPATEPARAHTCGRSRNWRGAYAAAVTAPPAPMHPSCGDYSRHCRSASSIPPMGTGSWCGALLRRMGYIPPRAITPGNLQHSDPSGRSRRAPRPVMRAPRSWNNATCRRNAWQSGDCDAREPAPCFGAIARRPRPMPCRSTRPAAAWHSTTTMSSSRRPSHPRALDARPGEALSAKVETTAGATTWSACAPHRRRTFVVGTIRLWPWCSVFPLGVLRPPLATLADVYRPALAIQVSDTWADLRSFGRTGGGSLWVTANYIPTHLSFWGHGHGGPWMGVIGPETILTASNIASTWQKRAAQGLPPYASQRLVGLGRRVATNPRDDQRTAAPSRDIIADPRATAPCGSWRAPTRDHAWRANPSANEFFPEPHSKNRAADRRSRVASLARASSLRSAHRSVGGKNWPRSPSPRNTDVYIPAHKNLCRTIAFSAASILPRPLLLPNYRATTTPRSRALLLSHSCIFFV